MLEMNEICVDTVRIPTLRQCDKEIKPRDLGYQSSSNISLSHGLQSLFAFPYTII